MYGDTDLKSVPLLVNVQSSEMSAPQTHIPMQRVKFPALVVCPSWLGVAVIVFVGGIIGAAMVDDVAEWVGREWGFEYTHEDVIKFGSIPIVSVMFTYVHIWAALYMTFYPIEFRGCCQIPGTNCGILGWQGIIPHKANEMAVTACKLMTEKLIDIREVFGRLDAERVSEQLDPVLRRILGQVTEEVALDVMPDVWGMLPAAVKEELVNKAHEDTPNVIKRMLAELQERTDEIVDLEHMVITRLSEDKEVGRVCVCAIYIVG
jgi:hypothetical protein